MHNLCAACANYTTDELCKPSYDGMRCMCDLAAIWRKISKENQTEANND